MNRAIIAGAAAMLAMLGGAAQAGTRAVSLMPPETRVEFTTYAMGVFPLPGHYAQFRGELRVDPDHPDDCAVSLDVDVASLVMADPDRVRLALGPKLLDQAAYPHLLYQGACGGGRAAGTLTMHGVRRAVALQTTRAGREVTATGTLRRSDFGIDGLPGLLGNRITITFTSRLPDNLASLIDP